MTFFLRHATPVHWDTFLLPATVTLSRDPQYPWVFSFGFWWCSAAIPNPTPLPQSSYWHHYGFFFGDLLMLLISGSGSIFSVSAYVASWQAVISWQAFMSGEVDSLHSRVPPSFRGRTSFLSDYPLCLILPSSLFDRRVSMAAGFLCVVSAQAI
jgi:hypothetical protein